MNNAERRLREVEERLTGMDAPAPPDTLLEAIQNEIPADLGAEQGGARSGSPARWRWLAASLAIATIGGFLARQVLREEPDPIGRVLVERAEVRSIDSEPIAAPGELGEVLPVEGVEEPEAAVEPPVDARDSGAERAEVAESDDVFGGSPQPESQRVKVEVNDMTGAAVPGATVTLEGKAGARVGVADADGKVEFGELQAGDYRVKTEFEGFSAVEFPEVRVRQDRNTHLDVSMSPEVEETITVTSESPLVDSTKESTESLPLDSLGYLGQSSPSNARVEEVPKPTRKLQQRRELQRQLEALPRRIPMPDAAPNDEAFDAMYFQAYGTNPFVDTEDDALSTFGIDVDTASFTMARSYLERGELPPPAAIRVEEFVNYFEYGDPAPGRRDFAVVAEGAPSPFASTARTYLLRFALQGREVSAAQRAPSVLTFVVDVSGSMNRENRLGLVKQALRLLVGQLDSGDAIGLVIYGSRGQVLLEPTSNHRRVMAAIERLESGGSTNAEEGLVLAYDVARRSYVEGAINRVILCSDGVANVGNTGPESILRRIGDEAEHGIELTTVGFGMGNYNDVLMEQLANQGDGNYSYVDDLDAARRVFVENLTGTLQTIAGDAKVQVEFDPVQVQSYRLLGYENRDIADRDFRNDAIDAGEIGAGHQVTALYEVKLRRDAGRSGRVAKLSLRYRSKRSGEVVEDSLELDRQALVREWRRAPRGLRMAAIIAEFAEVLRDSPWARDADLSALATRARRLGRSGSWDSEMAGLTEMIERAARLREGSNAPEMGDGFERD